MSVVNKVRETPRLLVSVRSVEEAKAAIAGGADIIDVKDPARGSLGRADELTIRQIADTLSKDDSEEHPPLSVALGEVAEFRPADAFTLPSSTGFAKLGLAGLRTDADWVRRWLDVRSAFEVGLRHEALSPPFPKWIAVIYADPKLAQSPPAEVIIDAAISSGCAGVLVDTFGKTGGRLLDHVSAETLAAWVRAAQSHGLLFAVAGRLRLEDVPAIMPMTPDVIAVRSAVCEDGDRGNRIEQRRIKELKRAIRKAAEGETVLSAIL